MIENLLDLWTKLLVNVAKGAQRVGIAWRPKPTVRLIRLLEEDGIRQPDELTVERLEDVLGLERGDLWIEVP